MSEAELQAIKTLHPKCGSCQYLTMFDLSPVCGYHTDGDVYDIDPDTDYCNHHTPKATQRTGACGNGVPEDTERIEH